VASPSRAGVGIAHRARVLGRFLLTPSAKGALCFWVPVWAVWIAGSLIDHWQPNATNATAVLVSPGGAHWLGTDQVGRDVLARLAAAMPRAYLLPIVAVLLGGLMGAAYGVLSASLRGVADRFLMWVNTLFLSVPALLLAIVVVGVFGPGERNVVIAIACILFPQFARLARGATLSLLQAPYIESARLCGASSFAIIRRHVIPNVLPQLVVMASLSLSNALMTEAALSFLGLGVVPPAADLGNMVSSSLDFMVTDPWLLIAPMATIVLLVLGFNFFGDALAAVLDPRQARLLSLGEARPLLGVDATAAPGQLGAVHMPEFTLAPDTAAPPTGTP
jgi:peptide/nickel transport system permease protein